MHIDIYSIGKIKDYDSFIAEYTKRIRWKVNFYDFPSSNIRNTARRIKEESKKILSKVDDSYLIALDQQEENLDSQALAQLLIKIRNKRISFAIGGAYGLDSSVLERADFKLSLSQMTFPHAIAKLIITEQIYRAYTILNNHPYNK